MNFEGIETENYTEREFRALPRQGRKSLQRAKTAGANFKPEKELPAPVFGTGPKWRRDADAKYTMPRPKIDLTAEKDSDLMGAAPVGPDHSPKKRRDRWGNPIGTQYDAYGNPINGEEEKI
jgi:hypothetical protein